MKLPSNRCRRRGLNRRRLHSIAAATVFRVNIDRDEAVIIKRPKGRSPSDRCDDVH